MWTICLLISVAVLIGFFTYIVVRSKRPYNSGRLFDTLTLVVIAVALSAFTLFVPLYFHIYVRDHGSLAETCINAAYAMFNLFMAGGDATEVLRNIGAAQVWVITGYRIMIGLVFILAPMLTFGVIMSFFKDLMARLRLKAATRKELVVFSKLNERSLTLATSMFRNPDHNRLIVFTDVYEDDGESMSELAERAKSIKAVCVKDDITMLQLQKKKQQLHFLVMSEDFGRNMAQSLDLMKQYRSNANAGLTLFSSREEDELLLEAVQLPATEKGIVGHCFNRAHMTVYNTLYNNGFENIFETAKPREDGKKIITAVVVGLGIHGRIMLKSLSWFCQMPGYELHLHGFDADPFVKERFLSECPDLMDKEKNGRFDDDGEAQYQITIHEGLDVMGGSFDEAIKAIPDITYVLVCTGDDDRNILTARKMRMLCEQNGSTPAIQAVIYDQDKGEALTRMKNHKKQTYSITAIGGRESTYCESMVYNSQWIEDALRRHNKWEEATKQIEGFMRCRYNQQSSVAAVIHREMKLRCQLPGILQKPEERSENDREMLRRLEHRRWCAYIRSEGYTHGEDRNDLAKKHNLLVPYEQLTESQRAQNDV